MSASPNIYDATGSFVEFQSARPQSLRHGIEPDVITLGAAVHAFARAGQQKEAERMSGAKEWGG